MMFSNYLLPALSAILLTFGLTGIVRYYALKKNIISIPRSRDLHQKPTPRLGGLAIAFGLLITLIIIYFINPDLLRFNEQVRFGVDRYFLGIIVGCIFVSIIGFWDDLVDLKAKYQFLFQFLAAGIIVASGIGIDFIRSPWGIIPLDQFHWPLFNLGQYSFSITLWSDLFTVLWLMLMMNVVNWFDGLDGLAAGVIEVAAVVLFILTLMISGNLATAILAVVLAGSIIGFLPWNWHPAKIFMGSIGSYLLGFLIGVIAIVSGGKLATAILVLGLPFFDAFWVAVRRIIQGRSPFSSDRTHLHHRLIKAGLSVPQTVLLLYFITSLFGVLALIEANAKAKLILLIWVIITLLILGIITFLLDRQNQKRVE